MTRVADPGRPVCDYEGSAYRTEFWGEGREYEDGAERVALRALLPPNGRRLIEIGAGFGRLVPLYAGYDEVVLFDYALSQLRQARDLWGDAGPNGRPRYLYVAGDFYRLPFVSGLFDTLTLVRTLHHAVDAPAVLRGVADVLAPGGTFVLEYANKRNVKAIVRYLARRQAWSPFGREPVEFVPLNFDFHPAWMRDQLDEAGFRVRRQRTVSHFRLGVLKRHMPQSVLVAMDRLLQPTGSCLQYSPSIFVQSAAPGSKPGAPAGSFFRCTACGSSDVTEVGSQLVCSGCGARFLVQDGIYDFKDSLAGGGA